MHIRHFILMGLFLGAAAFLPNNAFAEKNRAADQTEPQNSAVHTHVLDNIEKPKASEKAVSVTPKNENKSEGGMVQKPVTNPGTHQTVPVKPVLKSPNKTNRRVEKVVPPSLDKNVNASESAETAAKVKDTGKTGRAMPMEVTNKLPVVPKTPESLSSNQSKSEASETNIQPPSLNAKSEAFIEDTGSSVTIKTSGSLKESQKPLKDQENKTPSENRNHPGDIEIMTNPPQRMQTSEGESHEPFRTGASTISFDAHWFDWDLGLTLGSIYQSREVQYYTQWMNAPPSPPPKAAPFS
ncbi:hypothetical protein [Cytobacillus firmus]|uniref:hypothetical protein n=1 Tax=Cytobacillus firmus TaxID=1399 RepID=UPI0022282D8D|nr:hypothetical protein [Cytobacillus firmus]